MAIGHKARDIINPFRINGMEVGQEGASDRAQPLDLPEV